MNEWNLSYVFIEVKLHNVGVPLSLKICDLTSTGQVTYMTYITWGFGPFPFSELSKEFATR